MELTTKDVGDPTVLPDLLAQVSSPIEGFLADGAYDGFASRDLIAQRFGPDVKVVIPPPGTAILSPDAAQNPTARDLDIMEVSTHGRMAWQVSSGYNQRSRVETQMGRWKGVIGGILKARSFENQQTEAGSGCEFSTG